MNFKPTPQIVDYLDIPDWDNNESIYVPLFDESNEIIYRQIPIKRRKIMGITCNQTGKIRGIMRKLEIENEKNRKAENKEKSKKNKKENK